jgi:hypothetical protein
VDLVIIEEGRREIQREMVPLSDQVHLDISLHPQSVYEQPRDLRTHPWLGPAICEPSYLHDPDHFFEWVQASVRGLFHRPDFVHERAIGFLKRARGEKEGMHDQVGWLKLHLNTLLEGCNAFVSLYNPPVAGRRIALDLERIVEEAGHPEIIQDFQHMLGADQINGRSASENVASWARAFDSASREDGHPELHPCRREYHLQAYQAMIEAGRPETILWPLLHIWDHTMRSLVAEDRAEDHLPEFEQILEDTRLSPTDREAREQELENYLDHIEGLIEYWGEENGVL